MSRPLRQVLSAAAVPTARLGLAHVVAVQPTTLSSAIALARERGVRPAILSSFNLDEGVASAAKQAAAESGKPVDILVPAALAAKLLEDAGDRNKIVSVGSPSVFAPGAAKLEALTASSSSRSRGSAATSSSTPTSSSSSASVALDFVSLPATPLREAFSALRASEGIVADGDSNAAGGKSSMVTYSGSPATLSSYSLTPPPLLPGSMSFAEEASIAVKGGKATQRLMNAHAAKAWKPLPTLGTSSQAASNLFPVDNKGLTASSPSSTTLPANSSRVAGRAFFDACRAGNISAIFEKLGSEKGLSPHSALTVDDICAHVGEGAATPLHALVSSPTALGDVEKVERAGFNRAVEAILNAGADIDARAANGSTPLHWAAGIGSEAAVSLLLSLGADARLTTYTWRRQVFGKGSGRTALHWAAESNHERVVAILAEACAETLGAADERGRTPSDVAAEEASAAALKALAKAEEAAYVVLRLTLESSVQGKLSSSKNGSSGNSGSQSNSTRLR
jgi:hypothetical protein